MIVSIPLWVLPLALTLLTVFWLYKKTTRYGDYDFSILFDLPFTGFVIAVWWLIYFVVKG